MSLVFTYKQSLNTKNFIFLVILFSVPEILGMDWLKLCLTFFLGFSFSCGCSCCSGLECSPTNVGTVQLASCIDCTEDSCYNAFPSQCPNGGFEGSNTATCSVPSSTGNIPSDEVVTCAYYKDAACSIPADGFVNMHAYYRVGICTPISLYVAELLWLAENATICFYLNTDCSNPQLYCFEAVNEQCTLFSKILIWFSLTFKVPGLYAMCSWDSGMTTHVVSSSSSIGMSTTAIASSTLEEVSCSQVLMANISILVIFAFVWITFDPKFVSWISENNILIQIKSVYGPTLFQYHWTESFLFIIEDS